MMLLMVLMMMMMMADTRPAPEPEPEGSCRREREREQKVPVPVPVRIPGIAPGHLFMHKKTETEAENKEHSRKNSRTAGMERVDHNPLMIGSTIREGAHHKSGTEMRRN